MFMGQCGLLEGNFRIPYSVKDRVDASAASWESALILSMVSFGSG